MNTIIDEDKMYFKTKIWYITTEGYYTLWVDDYLHLSKLSGIQTYTVNLLRQRSGLAQTETSGHTFLLYGWVATTNGALIQTSTVPP